MALRTVAKEHTFAIWRDTYNLLVADVGDKALLTTTVTSSVVAALNNLEDQIDGLVVGSLSLANNVYLTAAANGGGSVNLIKANPSNKIEFGVGIQNINIESGQIVLTTPLGVASGGTGGATASAARTNLGLTIGTNVQAWDVNLDQIAALSPALNSVMLGDGTAWTANTPTQFKTAYGLTVGTNVQAWDAGLDSLAALVPTNDTFVVGAGGNSFAMRDAAYVRSVLSLVIGTNVQAWDVNLDQIAALVPANNNFVVGNGASWFAATQLQSQTALGLIPGTNVQAWDTNLDQIAALTPAANSVIIGNSGGTAWVAQSGATLRTSIGLAIGTNVQAWDTDLDAIAALGATNNNFIVGNGTAWVKKTTSEVNTILNTVIGVNVQAFSTRLQDLSSMSFSGSPGFVVWNGASFLANTASQYKTNLQLTPGTDIQAFNQRLADITSVTLAVNNILVWNGSTWVGQGGAAARGTLGAAASGTNTDITSADTCSRVASGFGNVDLFLKGQNVYMSCSTGGAYFNVWEFQNDGALLPVNSALQDIGSAGNRIRSVYFNTSLNWSARPTDWSTGAFAYTRRVSLNPAGATAQQVAEFALSLVHDIQTVGLLGGTIG